MKLAARRDHLLSALEHAAKIAPTTKTIPILNYLRLDATDDHLTITATNLMTTIVVTVPETMINTAGSILAPAHDLLAIVRSDTAAWFAIAEQPGGLVIKGTARWQPKTPPVDQYPKVPTPDDNVIYTLPREPLLKALRLVRPAAADSLANPKLEQVGIRHGTVQAADGIRLHQITLPGVDQPGLDLALPLHFLSELTTQLTQSQRPTIDLGVTADHQALSIRHDHITLFTTVKRETFPDVDHAYLQPAMANTQELRLDRDRLADAIRRTRILADPATRAVMIKIDSFTDAEISTSQISGATATETIPVEWAGEPRTLTVDHQYLLHLLALFESSPTLTLRLGPDAKHRPSPILIDQDGRAGVLMQLRLDWQL